MLDDPADPLTDRAPAPLVGSASLERSPGAGATPGPDRAAEEFAQRVDERIMRATYAHGFRRTVLTLQELARGRGASRHESAWVPLATFAVTGVSAVLVAFLSTRIAGPGQGEGSELLAGTATMSVIVSGFAVVTRAQDRLEERRPLGRLVRADVADAYETVREGTAVLVELGVPPTALALVADLLPRADRMLDLLVEHEARGGDPRTHRAYGALIRMGAEVTVLTDMAEERMGRRSETRRDRPSTEQRIEPAPAERALATLEVISDLIAMLGPDVPRNKRLS